MRINTSSIIFGLPPLIIAAVLSVAVPSFAAPQTEDQGDSMRLQLGQLHNGLNLTGQQEQLWMHAENASRDRMKRQQAERRQAIHEMEDALNNQQVDLRALAGKMDARREMAGKDFLEVRELWLAFYDSLDARQRDRVRGFLLGRIEQMENAMAHRNFMRHDAPV